MKNAKTKIYSIFEIVGYIPIYILLIVGSAFMLYPLLYGIVAGFMDPMDYLLNVSFFPIPRKGIFIEFYKTILIDPRLLIFVRNTVLKIIWQTFFTFLTSLLLGYVFSKLRFKGRNVTFWIFISSMMIPAQATMVPSYIMWARWPLLGGNDILGLGGHGMLNSWWIFLFPSIISVYSMFLMKQMFDTLPSEIEESARLDGAGTFTIIGRLYTPLLKPVLAVVFLGIFTGCWNDFTTNLIYTDGQTWELIMVSFGVNQIANSFKFGEVPNYPAIFAAATILTIPPIIIYMFVQKSFVEGIAMTGIKG